MQISLVLLKLLATRQFDPDGSESQRTHREILKFIKRKKNQKFMRTSIQILQQKRKLNKFKNQTNQSFSTFTFKTKKKYSPKLIGGILQFTLNSILLVSFLHSINTNSKLNQLIAAKILAYQKKMTINKTETISINASER